MAKRAQFPGRCRCYRCLFALRHRRNYTRGSYVGGVFTDFPDVELVSVCDVFKPTREEQAGCGLIARARYRALLPATAALQRLPSFQPVSQSFRCEGGPSGHAHVRNFLDCVKSRQHPVVSIDAEFYSTLPTLMGVLAVHRGKTYSWDGQRGVVV